MDHAARMAQLEVDTVARLFLATGVVDALQRGIDDEDPCFVGP